ncbi:hypothetical protein [Luteimonas abyssi]|uniref:hypothetical protein n=1 Tax=Luteimonas abyssi TaxID=1247514 RepID=UPI000737D5F7|nr:hypothetical protein [Luteimonas abyssi]
MSGATSPSRPSRRVPSRARRIALATALAVVVAAPVSARADAGYSDVSGYTRGHDALINAWFRMTWELARDFDQICGDTFCEGEYTNIEALRFTCSVHLASGRIASCAWSFAASHEEVDLRTGALTIEVPTWQCVAPLAPGTTVEALLAAVDGVAPLYAPLPGAGRSIYDGLSDCL